MEVLLPLVRSSFFSQVRCSKELLFGGIFLSAGEISFEIGFW